MLTFVARMIRSSRGRLRGERRKHRDGSPSYYISSSSTIPISQHLLLWDTLEIHVGLGALCNWHVWETVTGGISLSLLSGPFASHPSSVLISTTRLRASDTLLSSLLPPRRRPVLGHNMNVAVCAPLCVFSLLIIVITPLPERNAVVSRQRRQFPIVLASNTEMYIESAGITVQTCAPTRPLSPHLPHPAQSSNPSLAEKQMTHRSSGWVGGWMSVHAVWRVVEGLAYVSVGMRGNAGVHIRANM